MTPDQFAGSAQRLGPNLVTEAMLETLRFKIGDKAFATLGWPQQGTAVVKVAPARQAWASSLSHALTAERRRGKAGIIVARLDRLDLDAAAALLAAAWSFAKPKAPSRSTAVTQPRERVATAAWEAHILPGPSSPNPSPVAGGRATPPVDFPVRRRRVGDRWRATLVRRPRAQTLRLSIGSMPTTGVRSDRPDPGGVRRHDARRFRDLNGGLAPRFREAGSPAKPSPAGRR